MNKIPKVVFSRTLQSVNWNNSTLIKENASAEISKLKTQENGDIYLFDSANLSETFIKDDLFNECLIALLLFITAKGRYLVPKELTAKKLSLISS